jgi:hypothetical protein
MPTTVIRPESKEGRGEVKPFAAGTHGECNVGTIPPRASLVSRTYPRSPPAFRAPVRLRQSRRAVPGSAGTMGPWGLYLPLNKQGEGDALTPLAPYP